MKTYVKEHGSSFCTDFYSKLSSALHDGGVDGFIIETMNSWEEAHFALEGVKRTQYNKMAKQNDNTSLPIMVSLQGSLYNDENQNDPENIGRQVIKQFLEYVDKNPSLNIISFGLNCSSPEDMVESFRCIFKTHLYSEKNYVSSSNETVKDALNHRNIGVSAYPNLNDISRFKAEGYSVSNGGVQQKRQDMVSKDHEGFLNVMDELIRNFNVRYIGGCCGCIPVGIQKLYEKYC